MKQKTAGRASSDPMFARRIAIAVALSLAVHEIVAGFWPGNHAQPKPETVAKIETITLVRRTPAPTPVPTPKPTSKPTPPPIVETPKPMVVFTIAPRIIVEHNSAPKAAAPITHHRGGAAAPLHVVKVVPASPHPAPVVAVQNGTSEGVANGGAGTGGGAGSGDGGDNGTANGTGGNGTGNGDPTAPCGDVMFHPVHVSFERNGQVDQEVAVTVSLRNGAEIDGMFPYSFKFLREELNPFHNSAATGPDGGIPVQFPPAGYNLSNAPLAVQIVIKYSNPETGITLLPKCPPGAG